MGQPDGSYPRLDSTHLKSGDYNGMICSFVGKIRGQNLAAQTVDFECSDGGVIQLDASQAELPEGMDLNTDQAPIVEVIGQANGEIVTVRFVIVLFVVGIYVIATGSCRACAPPVLEVGLSSFFLL